MPTRYRAPFIVKLNPIPSEQFSIPFKPAHTHVLIPIFVKCGWQGVTPAQVKTFEALTHVTKRSQCMGSDIYVCLYSYLPLAHPSHISQVFKRFHLQRRTHKSIALCLLTIRQIAANLRAALMHNAIASRC